MASSPLCFVEVKVADSPKFLQEIEFMGETKMKPYRYPWRTSQEVKVQPSCGKRKRNMPKLLSGQIGPFCESLIDGEEPLAQIGVNWVLAIFCGSTKEKNK